MKFEDKNNKITNMSTGQIKKALYSLLEALRTARKRLGVVSRSISSDLECTGSARQIDLQEYLYFQGLIEEYTTEVEKLGKELQNRGEYEI